jgi:Nif-specific regulatory protein
MARGTVTVERGPSDPSVPVVPLSEIALTGIYEISKVLSTPARLETTLANVVNLLSSFMQMQHGVISLLADDGIPDITVGAGWNEGTDERYRARLPVKVIGQIVASTIPVVAESVADHPLFSTAEAELLGATLETPVSFIGVPVRIAGKVIGTLTIDRVWDGHYRLDTDLRFLMMVANLIGQTVQLHRAVSHDRDRLISESHRLQKALSDVKPARERKRSGVEGVIGDSGAIRSLLNKVEVVAKSNSPVLLRGESGTGKELIAKAIHDLSSRAKGPFVKINCAALPETVLESELFGHEKGAFTGAINSRKGRFELADKGTLFLDEIGEISASFQAKLLRVLQEQEFERVGGSTTIKVNVRIVAATNKDLEEAVARNAFRPDLYYRISVVPLLLPPLRDRPGDIPLLAVEFLKRFNKENERALAFDAGAIDVMKACRFPGNVRELENCIQRTATLADGPAISANDFACSHNECLSSMLWKTPAEAPESPPPEDAEPGTEEASAAQDVPALEPPSMSESPAAAPALPGQVPSSQAQPAPAEMTERERLINAMERAGWVQAKAARILGLTPRQIGYALKKQAIEIKRF